MSSALVNDVGLMFDIAGAVLLFKFGLPPAINRQGFVGRRIVGIDRAQVAKARIYDCLGRVGLALLIVGFGLQLLSNHVDASL